MNDVDLVHPIIQIDHVNTFLILAPIRLRKQGKEQAEKHAMELLARRTRRPATRSFGWSAAAGGDRPSLGDESGDHAV